MLTRLIRGVILAALLASAVPAEAGRGEQVRTWYRATAPGDIHEVALGDMWFDTTTNMLKRCLAIVSGACTSWDEVLSQGGSGTMAPAADNTIVGDGTAWQPRLLPSCSGATNALTYNNATDAFGCNTLASGGAPTDANYLVGTANGSLSNEQDLGALATGILLNTVSGGQGTISAYGGASCTNQFPRSLSASGAATCASVVNTDFGTQVANRVLAGPTSGADATPTFRALVADDIPALDTGKITTGTLATARLGSGTADTTTFLRGDQTWAAPPGGGVPAGLIGFFAGTCPSGWTEYTAARGRMVVGLPLSGTAEGTVGTALTNLQDKSVTPTFTGAAFTDIINHTHPVTDPGHVHVENNNSATTGGLAGWGARDTSTNTSVATGYSTASATTGVTTNNPVGGVASITPTGTVSAVTTAGLLAYIQLRACSKD